jgi:proline dehydrogenase
VVSKAASVRNFVRIDMEDARCTDREIDLFVRLKKEFPKSVGLVFQTYLRRTEDDILYLAKNHHSQESPLNIRICKGIYVESEQIAFKNADEIRIQYIKNLDFMLQNGIYAAIATHDKYLIDQAIKLISKHHVPRNLYEFQMLYGVTPNLRDSLVNAGHKMRLYVPFGQDWFGYCSRRIKENPKMASDILKALFVRG